MSIANQIYWLARSYTSKSMHPPRNFGLLAPLPKNHSVFLYQSAKLLPTQRFEMSPNDTLALTLCTIQVPQGANPIHYSLSHPTAPLWLASLINWPDGAQPTPLHSTVTCGNLLNHTNTYVSKSYKTPKHTIAPISHPWWAQPSFHTRKSPDYAMLPRFHWNSACW